MRLPLAAALVTVCCLSASVAPVAQTSTRPPLASADIGAIATLLKLEDTRVFDDEALAQALKSAHPEVRRRAILAIGRIAAKPVSSAPAGEDVTARAHALLDAARADTVTDNVATVAFSMGEMKDAAAVEWLGQSLNATKMLPAIGKEAACALGKIRTPDAHAALAAFLTGARLTAAPDVVGEALLSMGRFTAKEDIAPIMRWTTATNADVRWHATWALYRPKSPAAVQALLRLSSDPSPDVRFWAMRGLSPQLADDAKIDRAKTSARLRDALKDSDRRVRTEALRALVAYDDDASFAAIAAELDSPDSWLSVSAAEGLANFKTRVDAVVPKLVAAAAPSKPAALRSTSLASLVTLGATDAAIPIAASLAHAPSVSIHTSAQQALGRLGDAGRAALDTLAADPTMKDLLIPPPANRGGGAGSGRGRGAGGGRGAAGGTGRAAQPLTAIPPKPDADYRAMVTRWVVPEYNGAPKPHAIWTTEKGTIDLELNAGDAPIAMEYFVKCVEDGSIVGTEFTRVVPNFVAQQRTITGAPVLRDEVNRHGLTRANLSWASAGLDTGRPGYTLGNTPQPHNEGDFTALGTVVNGMDVVDRIELGDRIISAHMVK